MPGSRAKVAAGLRLGECWGAVCAGRTRETPRAGVGATPPAPGAPTGGFAVRVSPDFGCGVWPQPTLGILPSGLPPVWSRTRSPSGALPNPLRRRSFCLAGAPGTVTRGSGEPEGSSPLRPVPGPAIQSRNLLGRSGPRVDFDSSALGRISPSGCGAAGVRISSRKPPALAFVLRATLQRLGGRVGGCGGGEAPRPRPPTLSPNRPWETTGTFRPGLVGVSLAGRVSRPREPAV